MPDTINPKRRATRRVEREHRIAVANGGMVPRLDVGLLSQQVMNTVSVNHSESASFGTAASAPAVVAVAEGAGHFGQEKSSLSPRFLALSAVQGILRRDPGNEPQEVPDSRIWLPYLFCSPQPYVRVALRRYSISLSWLSITLSRGLCSCWLLVFCLPSTALNCTSWLVSAQVCHDLNGFRNSLQ
ncbi:hypothetical protein BGW80DRAFT_1371843 [Lactifluus volemus]|nr:hypothetical protein BGW80DRAFT_1371843 [Lactifluus volemus]